MSIEEQKAKQLWNNRAIPVILRRGGSQPVRLRIPFAEDNAQWLKNGKARRKPEWNREKKFWELPASRFNELVKMLLNRFGRLYIIQPYREKEICARACREAEGFECQCSCMGANHGAANREGWFDVTDAFAFKYGERKVACRLLIKAERTNAIATLSAAHL